MSESMFLLVQPGDGGTHLVWLGAHELRELLEDPDTYAGVREFLDALPHVGPTSSHGSDRDPAYWDEGSGMLLKVELVVPEPSGAYRLPGGM